MRIIARSTLVRFIARLAGRKEQRAHASVVGADRVVFNIKGNAYRLVVAVDYRRGIVFIKWLGTHAAYDKIDVKTVKYESETNQG